MKRTLTIVATLVFLLIVGGSSPAQFEDVGTLDFPTSGSPKAQRHFLRGVAILHSFGWKQAIKQFQKAQALEPDFAMAYWGESLCYNHPLIGERDLNTPRKVLQKLGTTTEQRLAKAPTEREKGFLKAVEALFFGENDMIQRRVAYMEAMRRLYETYPQDPEVAAFYALSLLSAAGPMGAQSHRTQVLAGSITLDLFQDNPHHPGAAHYTIHAFDDPIHAPLALPAAWKLAEIAPAVSHARHMPSHIFIQLGLWKEVSQSNQSAYEAAIALWQPGDSVSDLVHALDWGQYGALQQGDYDQAQQWLSLLQEFIVKNARPERAVSALPLIQARYIIETEHWQTNPVTENSSAHELLATGISAVKMNNLALAQQAEARLAQLAMEAPESDSSYYARSGKPVQIMHKEVGALVRLAQGNQDEAVRLLEEGVDIAESMRPPNGAANPVKPVHELFGEVLLEIGQLDRAIKLFETSLLRTPNRPRSVLGLARAHAQRNNRLSARVQYQKLLNIWEGRNLPVLDEAKRYLAIGTKE